MPTTPTLLLFGSEGQVGREIHHLARSFDLPLVAVNRDMVDITDEDAVRGLIQHMRPALVINAAAYTKVDEAESEATIAYQINRDAVVVIADACQRYEAGLLHISTDYVFDGKQQTPYREDDTANPISIYGDSKWQGEQAVRELCPQHIILRTSWVFGHHGHNFIKTMLRLARERDVLSVVSDQVGCPTAANDIAATLLHISRQYLQTSTLPWGTYHYAGAPATTWYGFATALFDDVKPLGWPIPTIHAITTDQYLTKAKRPMYSILATDKITQTFGLAPSAWQTHLKRMLPSMLGVRT